MGSKVMDDWLGIDPPQIPAPPPPPTITLPPPDAAAAADRARAQREQQDAARRRRGRSSNVYTGAEGVGATPVQVKTLVGS